ncbi:hypothetical protein [Evtepia sp.]
MCTNPFCLGLGLGMAAGTCLGIRLKAREKQIRRGINRAARGVENAFDTMTR